MRWRSLLVAILVISGAAVCVRLGFWQLSRRHEKQELNRAMKSSLAVPPVPFRITASVESLQGHRVEVHGRFDERHQVLLGPRSHDGSPGVEVVTPLLVEEGRAVLVNRGWLYSGDATWAKPQDYPDQGERAVIGIAEPWPATSVDTRIRVREEDGVMLLSSRRLERDLIAARLPYAVAPIVIRELPGPGVPPRPARAAPRPANEAMHLGYAVQWFTFAAIITIGSSVLALVRRGSSRQS